MNTSNYYKGFHITFSSNGTNIDSGRYFIRVCATQEKAAQFNPKGYATENTAKGAITKHLQNVAAVDAEIKADFGIVEAPVSPVSLPPARQGRKPSVSRNKREGTYHGKAGKFHVRMGGQKVRQHVDSLSAQTIAYLRG